MPHFSVKEYQNVGQFPDRWSLMVTDVENRPVPGSPQLLITPENQMALNLSAAQCNYAFEVGRQFERDEIARASGAETLESVVKDYVRDGYDKNMKYEALGSEQERDEFIDKALDKMKGSELLNLISMALQQKGVLPHE